MRGFNQTYSNLMLCFEDGLAVMIFNRPKALNALNAETLEQMEKALDEIEANPVNRVLLITGAGEKAFVAGADISELKQCNEKTGKKASQTGQKLFRRLEESRLFTIAGINGYALGGGLELALACDMRVAAEGAVLGLPEVSLGIIPGYGGTQRLTRLIGPGRALELICTGRKIDARLAHQMGLVNHVVLPQQLLEFSRSLAQEILKVAPLAVQAAKRCVHKGLDKGFEEGCKAEASEFGKLCKSSDVAEGMTAFLEKRAAAFTGA